MAFVYKILGQTNPADTNNADHYTVPAATSCVVSTITVTNVTNLDATYRIFVRKNGAAAGIGNAIAYDAVAIKNTLSTISIGMTLAAGDVVTVRSSVANTLTFQSFGSEVA